MKCTPEFFIFTLLLILQFPLSGQYSGTSPYCGESGTLMINEISQGPSGGNFEYIELVVLGAPSNPTANVDLTSWIIDDNNHIGSGTGNEAGHIRFSTCYNSVPPGSIIVIYNANERNTSLAPDDPSDANSDNVYIIPHNDACLNVCLSNPNQNTDDPSYCPCIDPTQSSNNWITQMNNSNDLIQVRNTCESLVHVLGWGLSVADVEADVLAAPVTLLSSFANIGEQVINFSNGDWADQSNYTLDPVATNETPGAPNNAANSTFIDNASNGMLGVCNGSISVPCDLSSAGKLIVPADANQANSGDTIIICEGNDIGDFNTSYDDPNDMPPPGGGPFNYLYAYFLTTADPPYTFINNPPLVGVSLTGDFDFSNLDPGTYRVWGVSLLIENLFVFLTTQNITSIQDLLNYVECAYDVDVTNLDNIPGNGEVIIKIIPEPDAINGFTIDTCSTDTLPNGSPTVEINFYDFNDQLMVDGNPNIFWYFDVDTSFRIPNAIITQEAQTVYAVIDFGGCRSTPIPIVLTLTPGANPAWDPPVGPICRNFPSFDLDSLITGLPGGVFTGNGVVSQGGGNYRYFPTLAIPGEEEITYTVGDADCQNSESHIFTIAAFPNANSITIEECTDSIANGNPIKTINLNEYTTSVNSDPLIQIEWYRDAALTNQIFDVENLLVDGTLLIYAVAFDGTCRSNAAEINIMLNYFFSNAGADMITCSSDPLLLEADPINGSWSSTGDGVFSNINDAFSNYTPGINDLANGTVELIWTVDYTNISCGLAIDTLSLNIGQNNLANAGNNLNVCFNNRANLMASPALGNWSSLGDGTFDDQTQNETFYLPGSQDNLNGFVELIWTTPDPDGPGPCEGDTDTILISYFAEVNFTCGALNPPTDDMSSDGSIRLTISSGTEPFECIWTGPTNGSQSNVSGSTFDIENLSQGNYTITLRDANNCEFTCLTSLASITCPITLDLIQVDSIFCFGDSTASLDLTVNNGSGNYMYDWNIDAYDGMSDLTNLGAGFYAVTVTDLDNACEASTNIAISQVDEVILECSNIMDVSTPNGDDGQGRVTISGGTEPYQITILNTTTNESSMNTLSNPGTFNSRNLTAGIYSITAIDGNGCEQTCSFTINQPGCNLTASIDTIGQLICNGDATVQINTSFENGQMPIDYDWNIDAFDGQATISNAGANLYEVTITDASGCFTNVSIEVLEPPLLELNCSVVEMPSSEMANDGVIRFDVNGGQQPYTIIVSGPRNETFMVSNSNGLQTGGFPVGMYNILLVDDLGCEVGCSLELTAMVACESDTNFIRELICPGDFIFINGTQYNEANLTGIEIIPGAAQGGCDSLIKVELETDLDVAFELEDPNCLDTTLGIIRILDIANGNGLYEYSLNGGNAWEMVGDFPFEIRIRPGQYSLSIRNTDGDCLFDSSVVINDAIVNGINIVASYLINEGDSVQLSFTSNFSPATIQWTPSNTLSCSDCPNPIAFPLESTNYDLIVTDSLGCTFTVGTMVNIQGTSEVFVPNVFSPNGDNINDFFIPQLSPEIAIIDEMLIFDRWGNLVFKATDIAPNSTESGWNGRYKEKALNPAVFAYWIKVTDIEGNSSFYKGDLTLIR